MSERQKHSMNQESMKRTNEQFHDDNSLMTVCVLRITCALGCLRRSLLCCAECSVAPSVWRRSQMSWVHVCLDASPRCVAKFNIDRATVAPLQTDIRELIIEDLESRLEYSVADHTLCVCTQIGSEPPPLEVIRVVLKRSEYFFFAKLVGLWNPARVLEGKACPRKKPVAHAGLLWSTTGWTID